MIWFLLLSVVTSSSIVLSTPTPGTTKIVTEDVDNLYFHRVLPKRGNEVLQTGVPDLYKHQGKYYVQMFCAIIATGDNGEGLMVNNEKMNHYKEIVQQPDGGVVIKPSISQKGGFITDKGYIYVGASDPRHQFQFSHRYNKQFPKESDKIVIRSFLLPLDSYKQALNVDQMTTENFMKQYEMNANVDKHRQNQFGFNSKTIEKVIMPNILPGSEVTFVQNYDSNKNYPKEWGTPVDMEELRKDHNMPDTDVPGIYNYEKGGRLEFYSDIHENLIKLRDEIKHSGKISDDLKKSFRNNFDAELPKHITTETVDAWIKETSYHITQQKNMKNEQMVESKARKDVKLLKEHYSFRSKTRKEFNDKYNDALKKSTLRKEKLYKSLQTFNKFEALTKWFETLTDVEKTQIGRHFKGISLSNILSKLGVSKKEWNNFHIGFKTQTDFENVYKQIKADISSVVDKNLKTKFMDFTSQIEDTNERKVVLENKNTDFFLQANEKNKVQINTQGFENIADIDDILKARIFGKTLQNVEYIVKDAHKKHHLIGEIIYLSQKTGILAEKISITDGNGYILEYDPVRNHMVENGKDLGTPRYIINNNLVINGKIMDRDVLEKNGLVKYLSQDQGTRIEYSTRDTIIDNEYESKMKPISEIEAKKAQIKNMKIPKSTNNNKKRVLFEIGNHVSQTADIVKKQMIKENLKVDTVKMTDLIKADKQITIHDSVDIVVIAMASEKNGQVYIADKTPSQLKALLSDCIKSDFDTNLLINNINDIDPSALEDFGKKLAMEGDIKQNINIKLVDIDGNLQDVMKFVFNSKFIETSENTYEMKKSSGDRLPDGSENLLIFSKTDDTNDLKLKSAYDYEANKLELPGKDIFYSSNKKDIETEQFKKTKEERQKFTSRESSSISLQEARQNVGTLENMNDEIQKSVLPCSKQAKRSASCMFGKNTEKIVPILSSLSEDESGEVKGIAIDYETSEKVQVRLRKNTFSKFKRVMKSAKNRFTKMFKKGRWKTTGMSSFGFIQGLYSFVDASIKESRSKRCENHETCPETKSAEILALSLKVESYFNIIEGAHGVVSDIIDHSAQALKSMQSSNAKSLSKFASTKHSMRFLKFTKVLGKVNVGVGLGASIISFGFSINQLIHAESLPEKVLAGLSVGFGAVNLAISAVATTAFIVAQVTASSLAASISAAAGPIGLVVGFLAMLVTTITSLSFEFKDTRERAQQVGKYFYEIEKSYLKGGFEIENDILHILYPAVVESIDIPNGKIVLGSQYIHRTKHGSSGSGKNNYFFWYKHFPKMVESKQEAINIRESLKLEKYRQFHTKISAVILPFEPKSYISYKYRRLPFCTAFDDKGFSVLRKLENDYRFDYDFYIFPGEQIVSEISFEYVETSMHIVINSVTKILLFPKIPLQMQSFYTYVVKTYGCGHTLFLQDGMKVKLESNQGCIWNIDIKNVTIQNAGLDVRGRVNFGNLTIIFTRQNDTMIFRNRLGGSFQVYPWQKRLFVSRFNASNTSPQALKRYLETLSYVPRQRYVQISNYWEGSVYIGKAFYETETKKFLFTNFHGGDIPNTFKDQIQLLQQISGYVIFKNAKTRTIWSTHVDSHKVHYFYSLYCGTEKFETGALQTEEFYLTQVVEEATLLYLVQPNEITLVSIEGKTSSLSYLAKNCIKTLGDFWQPAAQEDTFYFYGKCLYPKSAPQLPLLEVTSNKTKKHFWLQISDEIIHEVKNSNVFACAPSEAPNVTGIISPKIPNECDDLTLRYQDINSHGQRIYLFNCQKEKSFFMQLDDAPAEKISIPREIKDIEYIGNDMLVKSIDGAYYVFTNEGEFSLASLSFEIFYDSNDWNETLSVFMQESPANAILPFLGMKSINGSLMTAWYDIGREIFVIISPELGDNNYVFVGETLFDNLLWIYEQTKGILAMQTVISEEMLPTMITHQRWNSYLKPEATIVLRNIYNIEYGDGGVYAILNDGVLLHISYPLYIRLLGVNSTWMSNDRANRITNLNNLCKKYKYEEVITLGYEEKDVGNLLKHSWFHCFYKQIISVDVERAYHPVYLGENKETQTVVFKVNKDIVEIKLTTSFQRIQKREIAYSHEFHQLNASDIRITGDTLAIAAEPNAYIGWMPVLDNINSLVLVTSHQAVFVVTREVWFHYKRIIITSAGNHQGHICSLYVEAPKPCMYPYFVDQDDTVFSDLISDRIMVLEDYTTNVSKDNSLKGVLVLSMCDHHMILQTNMDMLYALPIYDNTTGVPLTLQIIFILGTLVVLIIFAVIFVCCCQKRKNKPKNELEEIEHHNESQC